MKVGFTLLLFFLLVWALAKGSFPSMPLTTFMWAGNGYFITKNGECSETLQTSALVDFMTGSKSKENVLAQFVRTPTDRPEVVVIWVQAEASMSHCAYSFLEDILAGASSSLVAPFIYKDTSADPPLSTAVLENWRKDAQVVVVSEDRFSAIKPNQLAEHLADNAAMFTNGIPDLVLIYVDEKSDRTTLINSVDRLINERTGGRYVAFFTADVEYVPPQQSPKTHNKRDVAEEEISEQRVLRSDFATADYWPRGIWEGLFVTALLLTILSVGLWCTYELQTPSRWERDKRRQDQ